jgi:hypothetical protein
MAADTVFHITKLLPGKNANRRGTVVHPIGTIIEAIIFGSGIIEEPSLNRGAV